MTRRSALFVFCITCLGWVGAAAAADRVTVRDAWARATPPGAAVAAVYLTIVGGAQPDRLHGATTSAAAMAQVHAITQTQGMARMRETDSLSIPASATVKLAPNGLHLMLMDLARPLVAGERFAVTLEFDVAGPVQAIVTVVAADATAPAGH